MAVGRWRLALCAVCGVLAVVGLGAAAPIAGAAEYEFERAFGPDGSSLTGFSSATSVAVDEVDGLVYVLDRKASALYKFDLEGNPVDFGGSSPDVSGNELSGLALGIGAGMRQVAVNPITHTIYVPVNDSPGGLGATALRAFQANGEPSLFTAGPGEGGNEIPGFSGLQGIAVDGEGNFYASELDESAPGYNAPGFTVFSASGAILVSKPGVKVIGAGGMAVDENGVLYVLRNLAFVTRYLPSEYPPAAATTYEEDPDDFDPNESSAVAIDPGLNRVLIAENNSVEGSRIARVAIFDEEGTPEGTFGGPGESGELNGPSGIAAGPNGEKVFVAQTPEDGGLAQVKIFKEEICICPPSIEASTASAVTGDSATLRAKINPNNLATTYWWEYGLGDCESSACTKVPLDGASIGDGRKGMVVTQAITGLAPQTVYHYRVVAENEEGLTKGPGKTFMTQGLGFGFALSDSRAWEMVSPSNK